MLIKELELRQVIDLQTIINEIGNLDKYSSYLYLLLSRYFPGSCLVALENNNIVGFVTSFTTKNTLFIWQIGVRKDYKRLGIASQLLHKLIKGLNNIQNIEFTISSSNVSSLHLFQKFSTYLNSKMIKIDSFSSNLFAEKSHEEEDIYSIKIPH